MKQSSFAGAKDRWREKTRCTWRKDHGLGPDNKDPEYQAQVWVEKEESWMVLEQISGKAKESTETNFGLAKEGESCQGWLWWSLIYVYG